MLDKSMPARKQGTRGAVGEGEGESEEGCGEERERERERSCFSWKKTRQRGEWI